MTRQNRMPLPERVGRAAEEAFAAQNYVSAVDVLLGLGWLNVNTLQYWRRGSVDCLEEELQTSPARVAEAMELLRDWAGERRLIASETEYVARTPQRQALRFSRGGDPAIEAQYRTHWVSPTLSEKERERLAEKKSRPPELVVIQPLNREWTCHRCGGSGDLLIMEDPGPACLRCAGLDDLVFLGRGSALLTRRAKAKSARSALVMRFSWARRRYERQGILVEKSALDEVEGELGAEERG
jgi:hypothetical protein